MTLWAAAFSFYAVLSMAPLLVLAVVGGSVYFRNKLSAQTAVLHEVTLALGPQVSQLFQDVLKGAAKGSSTTIATVLSSAVAFFAASNLFIQLDQAVQAVWKTQDQGPFIRSYIKTRLTAFGGVLVFGVATLIWLVFDSWLYWLENQRPGVPGWEGISFLASLAFLFLFFLIVLRTLPKHRVQWRDVWPGAILVAVGISLGKLLLNEYFARMHISAAYGSAGSIVLILLWVYYTSQIYFFGVELTYHYAHGFGSLVDKEPAMKHS